MMSRPVNFAVIGTNIGRFHLQGIVNLPEIAHLSGICEINEDRARGMAEKYQADFYTIDFNELISRNEIDAVILAVPHDLHRDMAVAAANAGKHILVEKPIAMTLEQADEIIAVAKENNVKLMTGHNMRYLRQHAVAKELVKNGVIGKPYLLTATVHVYSNTRGFRTILKHMGGGTLIDLGVHRFRPDPLDHGGYYTNLWEDRQVPEPANGRRRYRSPGNGICIRRDRHFFVQLGRKGLPT